MRQATTLGADPLARDGRHDAPLSWAYADQPPASIGCLTPRQAAAPLPKRDVALSYKWLDQYNREIRRKPIKIQAIWNSGPDTVRWDAKIYCPFQGEKVFLVRLLVLRKGASSMRADARAPLMDGCWHAITFQIIFEFNADVLL